MKRTPFIIQALIFLLIFLIYLILGLHTSELGFIGNSNAFLMEKALIIQQTGRLETAGFIYPPLPLLLVVIDPSNIWIILVGSISMGLLGLILFSDLLDREWNVYYIIFILVILLFNPFSLYIGQQNLNIAIGILFLYYSFRSFRKYYNVKTNYLLYISGLWLGLDYFVAPIVFYFAFGYAFMIMIAFNKKSFFERVSSVVVLLFPLLAAMFSWVYLSWLFTGNAVLVYPFELLLKWNYIQVISICLLFILISFLIYFVDKMKFLMLVIPLVIMLIYPNLGIQSMIEMGLLLSILSVTSITFSEIKAARWIIFFVGLTQFVMTFYDSSGTTEVDVWESTLINQRLPLNYAMEKIAAQEMRSLPPQSILTDDRMTYRIIAQAGEVKTFVLPIEPLYSEYVANPSAYFSYLLVTNNGNGSPLSTYINKAPAGMVVDSKISNYILYRRFNAPNLLWDFN